MRTLITPLMMVAALGLSACVSPAAETEVASAQAEATRAPADLNDLEIAHVAYTADNLDIAYAQIALKKSTNPEVRAFAETMIRDHTEVNRLALGLLDKLGATAQDNFLSQTLNANSVEVINKLNSLSGAEFDKYYASNELAYHKAVNDLVENTFIPNIDNSEVKELFEAGLQIFKVHEGHAEMMVKKLDA